MGFRYRFNNYLPVCRCSKVAHGCTWTFTVTFRVLYIYSKFTCKNRYKIFNQSFYFCLNRKYSNYPGHWPTSPWHPWVKGLVVNKIPLVLKRFCGVVRRGGGTKRVFIHFNMGNLTYLNQYRFFFFWNFKYPWQKVFVHIFHSSDHLVHLTFCKSWCKRVRKSDQSVFFINIFPTKGLHLNFIND